MSLSGCVTPIRVVPRKKNFRLLQVLCKGRFFVYAAWAVFTLHRCTDNGQIQCRHIAAEWRIIMKIAFSTLGCPNYDWKDIYSMAKDLGFDGIEIREIRGEFFFSSFSYKYLKSSPKVS